MERFQAWLLLAHNWLISFGIEWSWMIHNDPILVIILTHAKNLWVAHSLNKTCSDHIEAHEQHRKNAVQQRGVNSDPNKDDTHR